MLTGVVSPYDVHVRAGSVDAAMCLLGQAATLLPAPLEGTGPAAIQQAIEEVPSFERLMDSWRWSSELWHAGVLSPALDLSVGWPIEWVRTVAGEIASGPDGALKRVVGGSRFEDTLGYLNAICRDLTRGGADPGMSVPVSAGLSRYAAALGVIEFVSEQNSTVARLERRSMQKLGRVSLTIPRLLDGDEFIAVRERAASELESIGPVLEQAINGAAQWSAVQSHADNASEALVEALRAVDDRAATSTVSIQFGICDSDVVLKAAQRASSVATRAGIQAAKAKRESSVDSSAARSGQTQGGAALARKGVVRGVVRVIPFSVSASNRAESHDSVSTKS